MWFKFRKDTSALPLPPDTASSTSTPIPVEAAAAEAAEARAQALEDRLEQAAEARLRALEHRLEHRLEQATRARLLATEARARAAKARAQAAEARVEALEHRLAQAARIKANIEGHETKSAVLDILKECGVPHGESIKFYDHLYYTGIWTAKWYPVEKMYLQMRDHEVPSFVKATVDW